MNSSKLWLGLLALVVLVRLFALAQLPDTEFGESMHNLQLSRQLMETGSLREFAFDCKGTQERCSHPLPLLHLVQVYLHAFSGVPLSLAAVKLLPLILAAATFVFAYYFFRYIFPNRVFIAATLALSHSLLQTLGSINFAEPLAVLATLASAYFLHRAHTNWSTADLLAAALLLPAVAISQVSAFVLVPVFFLFGVRAVNVVGKKRLSYAALALAFASSSAWFVLQPTASLLEPLPPNPFHSFGEVNGSTSNVLESEASLDLGAYLFHSFGSLYNLPSPQSLEPMAKAVGVSPGIAWLVSFLAFLPLAAAVVFGIARMLWAGSKKYFLPGLVAGLIVLHFLAAVSLSHPVFGLDGRFFLPAFPLYAVAFVYALDWLQTRHPETRYQTLLLSSAGLFILFSSASALYFIGA